MIAAASGRLETVFPWSGGRRLHLLTRGELSARRRAAVVYATVRIADIDDLEGRSGGSSDAACSYACRQTRDRTPGSRSGCSRRGPGVRPDPEHPTVGHRPGR